MGQQKISIGILAPLLQASQSLTEHVESTGLATVKVTVSSYCEVEDDSSTLQLLEAQPDIILVDLNDNRAAIRALNILHTVLPETWLYACSGPNDPMLIIDTMHAGAREYLTKPVSNRGLSVAFGRYIENKENQGKASKIRGKVYSVTSAKGGAGATSVAVNMAAVTAELKDTRVALIDLNSPIGDAGAYLDVKHQFSLSDALAAAPRLDPVLLDTYMSVGHGIAVLPGPKHTKAVTPPSAAPLAKLLRVASQSYTHTFIDLPASINQETFQVVTDISEAVLVVMTPELPALWRTYRLLILLSEFGCSDRVRLIVNRDNSQAEIDEREISRTLNQTIFWRLPNNYSSAIQAVNKGKPIISVNHSGLASSYRKLTQLLTGASSSKRGKRLFKLFS